MLTVCEWKIIHPNNSIVIRFFKWNSARRNYQSNINDPQRLCSPNTDFTKWWFFLMPSLCKPVVVVQNYIHLLSHAHETLMTVQCADDAAYGRAHPERKCRCSRRDLGASWMSDEIPRRSSSSLRQNRVEASWYDIFSRDRRFSSERSLHTNIRVVP